MKKFKNGFTKSSGTKLIVSKSLKRKLSVITEE